MPTDYVSMRTRVSVPGRSSQNTGHGAVIKINKKDVRERRSDANN